MRPTILTILVAVILVGCSDQKESGRFQIIHGKTPYLPNFPVETQKAIEVDRIFKIDTKTGKTWTLDIYEDEDGNLKEWWVGIRESVNPRFE